MRRRSRILTTKFKLAAQRFIASRGYLLQRPSVTATREVYEAFFPTDAIENKRFYNIGAGAFRHPCWTNIDFSSDWYSSNDSNIDINFDLTADRPLPLADQEAELFFTSHTIEHIGDDHATNLFREIRRALKPGGTVRITCPNIDLYYRAFEIKNRALLPSYWNGKGKGNGIGQMFLYEFASQLSAIHPVADCKKISDDELDQLFQERSYSDVLDYCTSLCSFEIQKQFVGDHINWWNLEKLEKFLLAAGFSKTIRSGCQQSIVPVLRDARYFDTSHPEISLYLDAIR